MTLGLAFADWNYESLLAEMPRRVFLMWQAKYLLEPWDGSNRLALGKIGFKPPAWARVMVDEHERRQKRTRKPQYMTNAEVRLKMKESGY